MEKHEIMTLEEVAAYLRVSERTVYDWAQKGELPGGKLGTAWRFKRSDIEKWVDDSLQATAGTDLTPMLLESILTPERVLIVEGKTSKAEVLNSLIDLLAAAPEVGNRSELSKAMFYREKLMSTGVGMGIAIPHVRIPSVKDLVMAAALVREGLSDYDSFDAQPVNLVFMIAAGKDQHAEHIKTVSAISYRIKDNFQREALIESPDAESFFRTFIGKI